MKDVTSRALGAKFKTLKAVQLERAEFYLDVRSTDGRQVTIVFSANGQTKIKTDDSVVLVRA